MMHDKNNAISLLEFQGGFFGTLCIMLIGLRISCLRLLYFSICRWLKWKNHYIRRREQKRQKLSTPVEKVLSPWMSEDSSEPIYEDIVEIDTAEDPSCANLPPPVPALYSNMTFSTISHDTQSLPETVVGGERGGVASTNVIPPYISRYDSLVTWLKNMSTGVQE